MAERPLEGRELTVLERCIALYQLSKATRNHLDGWDADEVESTAALALQLQTVREHAETLITLGVNTGGFTSPQREALDPATDLVVFIHQITDDQGSIRIDLTHYLGLWALLTKLCCRLAAGAAR